jgi:hypothetical protein
MHGSKMANLANLAKMANISGTGEGAKFACQSDMAVTATLSLALYPRRKPSPPTRHPLRGYPARRGQESGDG